MINLLKKLGDNIKETNSENETPQLVIRKNQNVSHPGVLFDASLENTLAIMKTANNILKREERPNGYIVRNWIPNERLGDSRLPIREDECIINTNAQIIFTDTSGESSKTLSAIDRITYEKSGNC